MLKKYTFNQSGIASIIIVLIMIIVISVIVIGVSAVTRHDQTMTTNNQLQNQAFYASETGINDAITAIKQGYIPKPSDSTQCNSFIVNTGINNKINSASAVSFNCLLVNENLPNIETNIVSNQSTVLPINPSSPIHQLNLSWTKNSSANLFTNCPTTASMNVFPTAWTCPYAILRVDLYQYNSSDFNNSNSANLLNNDTNTVFIVPVIPSALSAPNNTLNLNFPASASGTPYILSAKCDNTNCQATFLFPSTFQSGYIRLSSIYSNIPNLTISSVGSITFSGAQLLIDSTGLAQNLSQRTEVRIPIVNQQGYPLPINALTTTNSICKSFMIGGSNISASVLPNSSCLP